MKGNGNRHLENQGAHNSNEDVGDSLSIAPDDQQTQDHCTAMKNVSRSACLPSSVESDIQRFRSSTPPIFESDRQQDDQRKSGNTLAPKSSLFLKEDHLGDNNSFQSVGCSKPALTGALSGAVAVSNSKLSNADKKVEVEHNKNKVAQPSSSGSSRWTILGHWDFSRSHFDQNNTRYDDGDDTTFVADESEADQIEETKTTKPPGCIGALSCSTTKAPRTTAKKSRQMSLATSKSGYSVLPIPTYRNDFTALSGISTRDRSQSIVTISSMVTEGVVNLSSASDQRAAARRGLRQSSRTAQLDLVGTNSTKRFCGVCGYQTHVREVYSLVCFLSRMKPLTAEDRVYKGYCLCCHSVDDLRQLMNDPNISLPLVRQHYLDIESSLRSLRGSDDAAIAINGDLALPPSRKRSPMAVVCAFIQVQILCGVILIALVGTCIGVGVTLSKNAEPWVSPPPTMAPSSSSTSQFPTYAPTSFEDNLAIIVAKDDVESFGYRVELSDDGNVMAVTSPNYKEQRGRLDVFSIKAESQAIGGQVVGDIPGDQLGIGMHISADGKVVAVGSPGNSAGTVQVYTIDIITGLTKKGPSIVGPSRQSEFGFSVSLNSDGSRLFVGAPRFGEGPNNVYGLVMAYDFDGTIWVQAGMAMIGESPNGRFGNSVSTEHSGNRVAIGVPLDNQVGESAGRIVVFDFIAEEWISLDAIGYWNLHESQVGSQLGEQVSITCAGTLIASGGRDRALEDFSNAGVVLTWPLLPGPDSSMMSEEPISGTYEGAHFGCGLQLDCSHPAVAIASSANRNGRVGSIRVEAIDIFNPHTIIEFFGPELGDAAWLGKGPSVSIAGERRRIAVGYESVQYNTSSRSEVRVYDYNHRIAPTFLPAPLDHAQSDDDSI